MMMRAIALGAVCATLGCAPSIDDIDATRGSRVDVYFNDPGSRTETVWYADAISMMRNLIDNSRVSISFAVMGFSHPDIIEAFERAWDRGVDIKMVGDAGHLHNAGYMMFADRHIPMVVGNLPHIMHDKFMVVDGRFVFASTSNWTPTDLENNSNNFVMIDSPPVARDFLAEHAQMFDGVFGNNKQEIDNGRLYQVGDTGVEVWFSPNEDAMGRILEIVNDARERVSFTIFAFTKDQVGSSFINKHAELMDAGLVSEGDLSFGVSGVIDKSQLHSNGQYHEAYRLVYGGIPMTLDGNDATRQPGDYQAGGGRLHSKTMVIDPDGDNPMVISGSFNWSASATVSNDEFLLVFRGRRIAQQFKQYFEYLWRNGKQVGETRMADAGLAERDLVFNEVHWYGAHDNDLEGYDEFIELKNRTDRDIRLDMWHISNANDFVVGIPPGSIVRAGETFTIVDHVLERYVDGIPQNTFTAFRTGDMIVNSFNDDRQARLGLKDGKLELYLRDPEGQLMDTAGDGGAAFAGGPQGGGRVRSMVRVDLDGNGRNPASWGPSQVMVGGTNVNPEPVNLARPNVTYRDIILATPGE